MQLIEETRFFADPDLLILSFSEPSSVVSTPVRKSQRLLLASFRILTSMEDTPPNPNFPIARRSWRLAKRARLNWLERHQHQFNFAIHLLGIPLAISGVILLFLVDWYWGAALFVLGYLFQWCGHLVEGNDVGEWIVIKKALGLRTVAISPKYSAVKNDD